MTEVNQVRIIDQNEMDQTTRAYWEMTWAEFLASRMWWDDAHLGGWTDSVGESVLEFFGWCCFQLFYVWLMHLEHELCLKLNMNTSKIPVLRHEAT
jgi:hypothetical protein